MAQVKKDPGLTWASMAMALWQAGCRKRGLLGAQDVNVPLSALTLMIGRGWLGFKMNMQL